MYPISKLFLLPLFLESCCFQNALGNFLTLFLNNVLNNPKRSNPTKKQVLVTVISFLKFPFAFRLLKSQNISPF